MTKQLTVGVGIPALNEEASIASLIKSILEQNKTEFSLKEIIIISDGSTDNTVQEARAINSPIVNVVSHSRRAGKSARLNEIFQTSTADVLVLFDADVRLIDADLMGKLIRPITEVSATLVSGRPAKDRTGSHFDSIMDISMRLQDYVKSNINDGDNVYACHGRILALSKSLYETLPPFESWTGDDAFIYFANRKINGKFSFATDAKVNFRMPQSASDFIKQQSRFASARQQLIKKFGTGVNDDFQIPRDVKVAACLMAFEASPLHFVEYIALRGVGSLMKRKVVAKWSSASTTKGV